MDDLPPNLPPPDDKGPHGKYFVGIVMPSPKGVTLVLPVGAQANSVSINLTFDDVRRLLGAVAHVASHGERRDFMIEGDC